MLRIVHTADWHWEADKIDKCQASANFIINKLREIKPDLHVIAGDYWNRRQTLTKLSAVIPALETMRELAEICPVVLIYGNEAHDAAGSYEIFRNLDTTYPIYVADRAETVMLLKDVDSADDNFVPLSMDKIGLVEEARVLIHLFPYPTKQWFLAGKENLSIDESNQLIQTAIKQIFTGFGAISMEAKCPVIFVGHCNVSGALLSSGQTLLGQDIMVSKHDLELARADYYALGHIHKAQEVGPRMHYSGSIYHCNFGEVEKKRFNVATFDERLPRTEVQLSSLEHIEIPSRPLSLHECEYVDDPNAPWVKVNDTDGSCTAVDWTDAELRIRVHLTKEGSHLVTDEEVKEIYPGAFSYQVERIVTPTERVRSADVTKVKTLPDKLSAWAQVTDQKLSPEVLALAGEVERTVSL